MVKEKLHSLVGWAWSPRVIVANESGRRHGSAPTKEEAKRIVEGLMSAEEKKTKKDAKAPQAAKDCCASAAGAEAAKPAAPRVAAPEGWSPKIVALCCHYCAYTAADLAGASRLQYSPSVEVVRIPCTGKVDVIYILKAFEAGADGVYVAGCLDGDCHFIAGNIRAKGRVAYAKRLIAEAGLEPERLEMYQLSAAEGERFKTIADEMTEKIRALGPSPIRKGAGK